MSRTVREAREQERPKSRNAARKLKRQTLEESERRSSTQNKDKEDPKQSAGLLGVSDY